MIEIGLRVDATSLAEDFSRRATSVTAIGRIDASHVPTMRACICGPGVRAWALLVSGQPIEHAPVDKPRHISPRHRI